MNRVGYAIIILFCAVALVYFLPFTTSPEKSADRPETIDLLTPTYRAEGIKSRLYGTDGVLIHQVSASEMNHFTDLGFMVFTQPEYDIFVADGTEYAINADSATLYEDNRIVLEDNIIIQSLNIDDFIRQINAQYLQMDMVSKDINSDTLIELTGAEFSMLSNGLTGNLARKQFALIDHVKTEFIVNQP